MIRDLGCCPLRLCSVATVQLPVCLLVCSFLCAVVPLKGCMVQYDAPGNRVVTLNLSSDRR